MINLHEQIESFRDSFIKGNLPEEAESCNSILSELDEHLFLNKAEIEALYFFFLTCGYIDYEKHELVHKVADKIMLFREGLLVKVGNARKQQ